MIVYIKWLFLSFHWLLTIRQKFDKKNDCCLIFKQNEMILFTHMINVLIPWLLNRYCTQTALLWPTRWCWTYSDWSVSTARTFSLSPGTLYWTYWRGCSNWQRYARASVERSYMYNEIYCININSFWCEKDRWIKICRLH